MSLIEDMIETHILEARRIKAANWQMYEHALEEVAQSLHCPVQTAQDVLHQISIETGQKPITILDSVYEFLQTLARYQDKEDKP